MFGNINSVNGYSCEYSTQVGFYGLGHTSILRVSSNFPASTDLKIISRQLRTAGACLENLLHFKIFYLCVCMCVHMPACFMWR